jgi:AmiR/NasT family two-component response regulator
MSGISPQGHAVALDVAAARLARIGERADRLQADLDSRIVERATGAISARLGTMPDVAYEILSGLARSQGRELEEYAEAVVSKHGMLDA